ncbi:MAG: SprB repeat-containing protein, partial [Cyclobacteriaceae bacterium]
MADLTESPPGGVATTGDFLECSGPVAKSSDEIAGQQDLNFGQITFTCGSELVLDDILLVWTAANGSCPLTLANNPNGKYCYDNPIINIVPPLNAMASASCSSGNNVDIDLTVQGGTMPFTYSWSNGATTEDLTNVAPGTYSVTAMDADGCPASTSITVGPVLTATAAPTDVMCFGDATGAIDLSVTGGVPPYMYSWDNGATTEDLSGLTAGTYIVTVTDNIGCEITESIMINGPPELTCSAVQDSPASSGNSDGVATVTPNGGTPGYTYLWDNGETTQQATGLNAGLHTVTVTDANGCETTCQVTIQELDPLECTVALGSDVLCNGENNGSATVTPTGGVAPFSYAWDNGEATPTATMLNAGVHTVTVTDAN